MAPILVPLDASATPPQTLTVRRVLVATDFSEPSQLVARWTVRHLLGDAELVLVHIVPPVRVPAFLGQSVPTAEALGETMRRGADMRLRELSASLGAGRVWPEVRPGEAAVQIAAVARDYAVDLIVVGAQGERTGAARWLGHTADRIVRSTRVPVLIGRNPLPDAAPQRLMAAIDDSPETARILAWTELLARRFAAAALVLHVVEPPLSSAIQLGAAGVNPEQTLARLGESASRWLDEQVAGLRERIDGVTTTVAFGDAATEILAAAKRIGADLIIVGRGGARSRFARLLGSVTHHLMRGGDRLTLVVPAGITAPARTAPSNDS